MSFFSVRLSACASAVTTGRISVKFDIGTYTNLSENQNLVTIEEKYGALYIKPQVGVIVSGEISLL
jgi:hypothetical protein